MVAMKVVELVESMGETRAGRKVIGSVGLRGDERGKRTAAMKVRKAVMTAGRKVVVMAAMKAVELVQQMDASKAAWMEIASVGSWAAEWGEWRAVMMAGRKVVLTVERKVGNLAFQKVDNLVNMKVAR